MKDSYEIEFVNSEGDTLECVCETLAEAKEELKTIRAEGARIKETWIYRDGQYKGAF